VCVRERKYAPSVFLVLDFSLFTALFVSLSPNYNIVKYAFEHAIGHNIEGIVHAFDQYIKHVIEHMVH
jgi:hypothetical protein